MLLHSDMSHWRFGYPRPSGQGLLMFASATIVLNPLKKTHSVCAQQVAHEIRELSIASVMTIWPGGITYSNVLPLHVESHRSGTQSHTRYQQPGTQHKILSQHKTYGSTAHVHVVPITTHTTVNPGRTRGPSLQGRQQHVSKPTQRL